MHLTPKYFFRLNNSFHLFETHCAFLCLFSPNLDFLQAVKVKKSAHHLFHERASKGYGSIPGLMSQTSLHACLQRLNTMQISLCRQPRNRPMPLITSSVVQQVMTRFLTLILQPIKRSRFSLKRRSTFRTGAKIYLREKIFWG